MPLFLSETIRGARYREISVKDPHLIKTIFDSQTTYPTAIKETESNMSTENLNTDSWEWNHFTATECYNQGYSSWSRMNLKYRQQKKELVYRLFLHMVSFWVYLQRPSLDWILITTKLV